MKKQPVVLTTLYCLAVIACIFLTFDYAGDVDMIWLLVLIVLTLPWSAVSFVFMWSLAHGAGLGCFTIMYIAFAIINARWIYCRYSVPCGKPDDGAS
jgi:hypothetical protein